MGLGKTVQTIKAMILFENEIIKNCIIVSPLSLQKTGKMKLQNGRPI